MVVVRKRNKQKSVDQLMQAIEQFVFLLEGQKEHEAIVDLNAALAELKVHPIDTSEFVSALRQVEECFTGDHELDAYTLPRQGREDSWTEIEQLYHASVEVLTLVKSLKKATRAAN